MRTLTTLSLLALLPTLALATPPIPEVRTSPEVLVDAFHAALKAEGELALVNFLAPDAIVFEGGHAEMSRDEYAKEHLPADRAFSRATTREVLDRKIVTRGEVAWVLSRTRTRGTWKGKKIDATGTETIICVKTGKGWVISHIHWS